MRGASSAVGAMVTGRGVSDTIFRCLRPIREQTKSLIMSALCQSRL
jgi:hypothetical protein